MNQPRHMNYDRFHQAAGEDEFFSRPLQGRTNLVWLPRIISGDYNRLAHELYIAKTWVEQMMVVRDKINEKLETIATYDDEVGAASRQVIADRDKVLEKHLAPDLRIAGPDYYGYAIYQPHMDIGDDRDEFGFFSCGYTEPVTGLARNEDTEFSYAYGPDRVYSLKPGAEKLHPGIGDFFRMATYHNKHKVEGVVHHAHMVREGQPLRMMLMARHNY